MKKCDIHVSDHWQNPFRLRSGEITKHFFSNFFPDMIATLGETTGHFALKRIKQKMLEDPVGRQIIK